MNALETAIYNKLAGGTALTTLLGGTIIYNKQPPDTAVLPWVQISQASGLEDNSTPRREQDYVYLIKGVASTLLLAGSLADAIDTLMHGTELTVTGYSNFWTARERMVRYQEVDAAGHTYGHAGGEYSVRLVAG